MPTNTFFNLPTEKRTRVINAAIDEFAAHSFYKSSINRIVDKADIPKGSFYQYFEDKKDLFKHIISLIGDRKLEYLNQVTGDLENLEFFAFLRDLYQAGVKFAQENPKLNAIGARVLRMNDTDLKEEVMGESADKSNQFLKQILQQGIDSGEVDSQIDVELTAVMLTELSQVIIDNLLNQTEAETKDKLMEFDEEEIMVAVDKMLYIVKNGIEN